jgi:hypothetical protein
MSDQFLGVNHVTKSNFTVTKKNINSLYIDKLRKYIDFLDTMQDDNIETIRELNRLVSNIDFMQNDASITKDVNIVIQNIKQEYNEVFSVLSPFYEDDDNIKELKSFLVDDLDYTKRTNNFENFNTKLNILLNEKAKEQAEAEAEAKEAEAEAERVSKAAEAERVRKAVEAERVRKAVEAESALQKHRLFLNKQKQNTDVNNTQNRQEPLPTANLYQQPSTHGTDATRILNIGIGVDTNPDAIHIPDADVDVLDPRPQTTRFGKIKRGLAQIPGVKKVLGITGTTTKHSDNAYTSKNPPKKGWLWGGTRRKARKSKKARKSRKSKKTRKSKKIQKPTKQKRS